MTLFFDELNNFETNLRDLSATTAAELTPEERIKFYTDEVLDMLILAWSFGKEDALSEIGEIVGHSVEIPDDTEKMRESIYRVIDEKDFADRIAEYAPDNSIEDIIRVVETDSDHNYNAGKFETAVSAFGEVAKEGATVRKRWNTAADELVRDTHSYLEGVEVGLSDKFYTYDGDSTYYPTAFSLPQNNINCRCWITLIGDINRR